MLVHAGKFVWNELLWKLDTVENSFVITSDNGKAQFFYTCLFAYYLQQQERICFYHVFDFYLFFNNIAEQGMDGFPRSNAREVSGILTHWGLDKMAAILPTTFSKAFSWIKM